MVLLSPVIMAILVLSLCLVFHRISAKGFLAAVNIRRERGSQPT